MRILTIIFLLISFTATAQNFDVLPTTDTVLSTDKMLIRPLSTTSPALRRITLEQLKRFVNRGVTATDTTKWSLTGNAGTTAGTNFIGTTDNQPFVIKVFNERVGYLDYCSNISLGCYTLVNNIGTNHVALGTAALLSNTTGSRNTAVGNSSLILCTNGNENTALGSNAGNYLVNGSYNTFLGAYSFAADSINYSTAIGYSASVGCDSCIVLGDTSRAVKVGIGTSYPTKTFHVKGQVRIVDGTQSAGYVLTSDADGNASWQVLALTDTATLDFGTIAPNGHETLTITVTGAALDDVVSLGIPNSSVNDHGAYMAWVSATDTVSVKCYNFDGVGFDPAAGVFKVKVFK